jgi:hypothetical protein
MLRCNTRLRTLIKIPWSAAWSDAEREVLLRISRSGSEPASHVAQSDTHLILSRMARLRGHCSCCAGCCGARRMVCPA